ncbi:hypothetical protein ACOMHN_019589 [Nucella lapillus]
MHIVRNGHTMHTGHNIKMAIKKSLQGSRRGTQMALPNPSFKKKEPVTKCAGLKKACYKKRLVILLVLALILGICFGILLRLREKPYTARERMQLRFPGEILVNMLHLLVIPLVVSSIISGLTLVDSWAIARMALRTAVYFMGTYLLSAVLGVILAVIILPRGIIHLKDAKADHMEMTALDAILDLIRSSENSDQSKNATNMTTAPKTEAVPELTIVQDVNLTGIIVMSVAAGVVIKRLGVRGLPLKIFFDAIYEVTVVLIGYVDWYCPIGVFFLVAENVVAIETSKDMFKQASFFITVMAGLTIHVLMVLPFVYIVVCRQNPYQFIKMMLPALVTAFGTSSSLATLPINMQFLEKKKVDARVVGFVAPIGASINMDGSAIYDSIATIFLGYAEGMRLDFTKLLTIGDRFRSTVNIFSDSVGCAVVHRLCIRDLAKLDISDEDDSSSSESSYGMEEETK